MISLIVACDENRGIGLNGRIPWFIPGELKWVSDVTRHTVNPKNTNALIMGRHTWESLPEARRPLPGRISIVVSSQAKSVDKLTLLNTTSDRVWVAESLEHAINMIKRVNYIEKGFIFGGQRLYEDAMASSWLDEILLTTVPGIYDCDTFFPALTSCYTLNDRHDVTYGETVVKREKYVRASQRST